MSNTNTGGPAFPTEVWDAEGIPQHTEGMTLRDYFAAKAMAEADWANSDFLTCAKGCYEIADAMLEARGA